MSTAKQYNQTPSIDPNEKQRIASNPAQSVWVDASAGTGKTKILTDRVLRLLLSENDRPASPPERIVCITFTKAAASEMALRITKTLSKWSILDEQELTKALEDLIGYAPSNIQITEARTLFARVIDVPGGLKIMTIHAFCQSILQKFPLEAGLSPNFTVLTEIESKDTIQKARLRILNKAKTNPDSDLGRAVQTLSIKTGEAQLLKFLESALTEKQQILDLFENIGSLSDLKPALFYTCRLDKNLSIEKLTTDFWNALPENDIKNMIEGFEHGTSSDQARIPKLGDALHNIDRNIETYCDIFLTQKGTIRKAATKGTLAHTPQIEFTFPKEAERCMDFIDTRAKLQMVNDTHDFLCVAHAILDAYTHEKQTRNALDFDDLISKTHKLLISSDTATQWVLFKLDQGIDHLLVDEAQDTNPDQWKVIEALSEEFFHGMSARDNIERTLFVVGDEKQSIYSFQKADPKIFRDMQEMFKEKVGRASKRWKDVPLNLSFRSTNAVLTLVDLVFAQDDMQSSLTAQNLTVEHSAFREGQAGHVELWPLIYGEEKQELAPWPIPDQPINQISAADLMAQKIAGTIKQWLVSGRKILSEDRPLHAGDIMILLKKRSQFQKNLVRALKDHGIPVGGLDRLVLQDHIAVKDVLATLEFGLLPQDDLTLATILKSPLIGWDEDKLMNFILENQKEKSLWSALQGHDKVTYNYLLSIHDLTLKKRTFDVVSFILNTPCPQADSGLKAFVKRLGEDAIDPLQELLNTALDTETEKGLSVQSFVHRLKKEEKEIKREMEDGTKSVRIMTVHGSKGLQAPIVFLPDTIRVSQSRDTAMNAESKLLWPRRSNLDYPFWAPGETPKMFTDAKEDALTRDDREYQRLLYVALTRASDELYIAGYLNTPKSTYLDDSWYKRIESAAQNALETGVRTPCHITNHDGTIIITNEQTSPPKKVKQETIKQELKTLPTWATQIPRPEPSPARPLQPSRPSGEVTTLSPLSMTTEHRYKRGNIIHALLEFLPDLNQDAREKAATSYVSQPG
ncbi:MAG: double-strand break repair helicase AddA, partial [Bdellovibrionales bacterium]